MWIRFWLAGRGGIRDVWGGKNSVASCFVEYHSYSSNSVKMSLSRWLSLPFYRPWSETHLIKVLPHAKPYRWVQLLVWFELPAEYCLDTSWALTSWAQCIQIDACSHHPSRTTMISGRINLYQPFPVSSFTAKKLIQKLYWYFIIFLDNP